MFIHRREWLSLGTLSTLCLALRLSIPDLKPPLGRMNSLPARTLWVWERPWDLHSVDPRTTALGILDTTIVLGHSAVVIPQRPTRIYLVSLKRTAVIRIEAPGPITPVLESTAADLILSRPPIRNRRPATRLPATESTTRKDVP